ncbi:MAG: hypothetical protein IKO42_01965, partial [Opitutales bacterium]|nr:hypothetical protein [Opitutales bacterium]
MEDTIKETVSNFYNKILPFQKEKYVNGLLLGNVQSGKTSQMFGIISAMADWGYNFFILLTTDNVYLQQQTKERVEKSFNNFLILDEQEEIGLLNHKFDKPVVIILKKNSRILKKWYNILSGNTNCKNIPFVFFDDEADAASLNTKVNSGIFSSINKHLNDIKAIASKSIYIQVT